jgi:hypothetical protein
MWMTWWSKTTLAADCEVIDPGQVGVALAKGGDTGIDPPPLKGVMLQAVSSAAANGES